MATSSAATHEPRGRSLAVRGEGKAWRCDATRRDGLAQRGDAQRWQSEAQRSKGIAVRSVGIATRGRAMAKHCIA